ncbi:SNF2-related protein [Metarhizium album ARSEF 1941]|uniref:SNF2-related protein n=1 Tax=Metarhizium album (strain ARSEF 1941) TaxID=1081103 RepID=A0A0B2X0P2_METAS|nr:SNF2-related protein [Metarhizium album ARSEF 1941]KHN99419.1 SNF2-related protein [Metarhizium album ARSEF 1941]
MEEGDDTLPTGYQAADSSSDNNVLQDKISFDFSADQSSYGSSSQDDSDGLMVPEKPYREPEAAKHSANRAVSEPRVSPDENGSDLSLVVSVEAARQPSLADPDTRATQAQDTDILRRRQKLQVSLPFMELDARDQYEEVHSNTIERVLDLRASGDDDELLAVELTDGTQCVIPLVNLETFENGPEALETYFMGMERAKRKRKAAAKDYWESGSSSNSSASDAMDLDADVDAEEPDELIATARRSRRWTREPTALRNATVSNPEASDESDVAMLDTRRRSLRQRPARPPQVSFQEAELDSSPGNARDDDDDGDDYIVPVVSDLGNSGRRTTGSRLRSRRRLVQKSALARSGDSDIEFEQPRRSSRATRNVKYMQDDFDLDEDSFTRVEKLGIPKIVSVKELFRPVPLDSPFAIVHRNTCHTCGSANQRSQIIYCQGCSYSYHKHCIGPRSAREHLVSKIGEADFVLQCRFCIEIHKKKDPLAPRRSVCQLCKTAGLSCSPFSQKQTARQEEKLRKQNGGVDPVTNIPKELVNNSKNVLFRCTSCNRGWHQHHLPSIGSPSPGREQAVGALKDYSIDWQCNECAMAQQKIHRLVAWRTAPTASTERQAFAQLSDDDKEYLVKWEGVSYFHCTWMPGAWIFGVAASVMRTAFAKKALEVDLFKTNMTEAIPDEYLMIDIIFRVKLDPDSSRADSREEEIDNLPHISKALVKFQGLGYDDVVWDKPPKTSSAVLYNAFEAAYKEYLAGKYFKHSPQNKMKQRIKAFKEEELEEVEVQPAGLARGKLMGYQLEGLNWLLSNFHYGRSIVLADEMGLGKTIQVISLVVYLVQDKPKCWPFLISVPNATCQNWRREFKQWAPELRVVTYHGGKESQDLAYKYELFPSGSREMAAHVVIMSYDSTQDPKTSQRFSSVKWAGLVVDEGQRLKNDRSLLYQALRVMKIPFRLLLTGTPLQNNKRELFNLIQFIDHSQSAEKLDEEFQVLDKETLPKLHDKIRPYFLRRTKVGVLKFLPPMAQIILPVTMTVIQEKLSKSIMAKNPQLIKAIFANSKVNRKERGSLNNILVQLRKCLCHPFMYSEAIEEKHDDPAVIHRNLVEASAKLLLLEQMLPKLKERGHRVLIFSQFLQQLDIIEDFLTGIGYQYRRLDGQLSSLEKQRRIDAYNEPGSEIFAFLLSTRAGGVGINLATADTVIIMDPDFNPHQDIQALSRAHRIGQKQKVLCFQLMTKDTVEEKIMQVGKKKMALDHALIESMDDDDVAGDDLEIILSHGAQALFSDDYQKGAIKYDGPSIDRLLDRSQTEQTRVDEEGSAEAQFSFAKVWSNDKASLEDELEAAAETDAPEPISSSVWDKILAEREAEARRHAEANKERLGRGERRRTTNTYKPDSFTMYLQDGDGPNASDSSDEFAGANSSSTSDEDDDEQENNLDDAPTKRPTTAIQTIQDGSTSNIKTTHELSEDELHGRDTAYQSKAQAQPYWTNQKSQRVADFEKGSIVEHPIEKVKFKYRNPNYVPPRIRYVPSNEERYSQPAPDAKRISNGPRYHPNDFFTRGVSYAASPAPYPFDLPQAPTLPSNSVTGSRPIGPPAGFPTLSHSRMFSARSPTKHVEPLPSSYSLPQTRMAVESLSESDVRLAMDAIQQLPIGDTSKRPHFQVLAKRLQEINQDQQRRGPL